MLAGSTNVLATMRISANQTGTTHTPTYTAVKASGSMDTVNSNGSVLSTVASADVRENGVSASPAKPVKERDSSWLELEVCREFARQNCPRSAEECRFAHPEPSLAVKEGIVTCCYDFLKDRCQRQSCKYFHPPAHIKQRLITAGKQFAMMSGYYAAPASPYVSPLPPAAPVTPILIGAPVMGSPALPGFGPAVVGTPYGLMTDRLHTCPEFLAGRCTVQLCPLVHPEVYVRRNLDSTVTICRDFSRGGCVREHCRYLHPPPHILSQLESALMATMPQGVMMAPAVLPPNFPPMVFPGPPPCGLVPPQPVVSSMMPVYPGNPVPIPVSVGIPMSRAAPFPGGMIPISTFPSVPVGLPRTNTPPSPISVISGQSPLIEAPSVLSPDQPQGQAIWMPTIQTVQQ